MSHWNTAVAGPGQDAGPPPAVPDLTDADLRTLRVMDDPEVRRAVDEVLHRTRELAESWWAGEDSTRG
ncbi:hypothetical protein AR457_11860 [Streptomyces agglomeratus]|uniref:FXSXX-COOH protein n=1 Tax=Streptomyces agglomeratus TaxID=285458 RepID=A0A1E5P6R7_9ACTN|nr:hypothetical protein [Streptomyces agglomeratus]OEJ25054.1 hypothetical protein AS594_11710 [Streptomyces agglomeratus]OEJ40921.1 hypothetical protein BGK70_24795 [Streptomyces agglomeratus]OEJ44701.1 hypothetical protein AR457_11860 [Streptomyces agglomeratus]OEJ53457.1 hypothetical protein BGK72_24395 [Streptomyces agglomeratus]OEJ60797.1 hypothetical protein BGM19_25105 [Streptomyces agglomeratus]